MIWTYVIIAVILLIAELCYFKIADHFNIIDKPNERSSHVDSEGVPEGCPGGQSGTGCSTEIVNWI